jgi:hypothetical protein
MPRKLEFQIAVADNEEIVVHGDALIIEGEDHPPRPAGVPPIEGDARAALLQAPGPLFPCLLAPRSCLEKAGFLDENVPAYQEWDTSLALSRFCKFRFIARPLMTYRLHGGDQISKNSETAARGFLYIVEKHRAEIRSVAGTQALYRHYLAIAERFLLADQYRTAARHTLTAYRFRPRSIHLLARIGLLWCGESGARILDRRRQRQTAGTSMS